MAATGKQKPKGTLVKYMGSADVRVISKGDTFNGLLPDGLSADLRWDWSNHHILDLGEAGLSQDEIDLVLEDGDGRDFKDVTGKDRVPPNLAQQIFRGAKPHARLAPDAELPEQDTTLGDVAPSGASTEGTVSTPDPALGAS